MKTPEQLKGAIRSIAASRNLRSQEVLQMFLFAHFGTVVCLPLPQQFYSQRWPADLVHAWH